MTSKQVRESHASGAQMDARGRLRNKFQECSLPIDDLMTNLGLYIRGSALVKFLVLDDLYRRILDVPGAIVEFGCWLGQNLVIFENLRAIYEPFNKSRHIIGFDTFAGYEGFSDKDKKGEIFTQGNFSALEGWAPQLQELLEIHEASNVLGHLTGAHRLISGNVVDTARPFFSSRPGLTVAMAYFDMGLYEPTRAGLEAIKPHLVPGSVILLDEFTWEAAEGEARAFKDVFGRDRYKIEKSKLTPLRAIVTLL